MATIRHHLVTGRARKRLIILPLLIAVALATTLPAVAAPVGSISGRIMDEIGNGVPQGRVEVYAEDGTFIALVNADVSGNYQTDLLDPGTYYLLFYNGDDEFLIGWFPQWYGGAPLLRSDRAQGVTITTGNRSGIDIQLFPFYDDMFDSVFEDSIAWMQYAGITQGCDLYLYCPNDEVTRGEMAAFLVRALFLTDDGGGDLYIDDDQSVFEGAIDRLGTAGITRGCNPPTNTRFCPDDLVSRGQMAAFLVRALGYTDDGGGDLFIDDDGSVFEGAIDRLGTAGVTRGCNPPTNTRFCPDDDVTRGEMAAFLKRALGSFYLAGSANGALSTATLLPG